MTSPAALALAAALAGAAGAAPATFPDAAALAKREARYAPVSLVVPLGPAGQRAAGAAAGGGGPHHRRPLLRQVWAGNEALLWSCWPTPPLGRAR
jgi:hypothetical protein